jgi:hypothetical protein
MLRKVLTPTWATLGSTKFDNVLSISWQVYGALDMGSSTKSIPPCLHSDPTAATIESINGLRAVVVIGTVATASQVSIKPLVRPRLWQAGGFLFSCIFSIA